MLVVMDIIVAVIILKMIFYLKFNLMIFSLGTLALVMSAVSVKVITLLV